MMDSSMPRTATSITRRICWKTMPVTTLLRTPETAFHLRGLRRRWSTSPQTEEWRNRRYCTASGKSCRPMPTLQVILFCELITGWPLTWKPGNLRVVGGRGGSQGKKEKLGESQRKMCSCMWSITASILFGTKYARKEFFTRESCVSGSLKEEKGFSCVVVRVYISIEVRNNLHFVTGTSGGQVSAHMT